MNNSSSPIEQKQTAVVAFRLDNRAFALPLESIAQILPMMAITPIPQINKIVKGTINIRGEDILIINLRSHLGIEEEPVNLYTPLLLLKSNNRSLALIIDSVTDVVNLPLEKITRLQDVAPEGIESVPLLRGVAYHDKETILVLDPDHLFDSHQHIVITEPAVKESSPAPDETPPTKSKSKPRRKKKEKT